MIKKVVFRVTAALVAAVVALNAWAAPRSAVFYVAPNGRDSAAGTSTSPWRTIQHAANTLRAGQVAIVRAGTYNERVSIASSGTPSAPIWLEAASGAHVTMLGFDISGSYWVVGYFDISTRTKAPDGYGIYVHNSASHDTVLSNYIHELCHVGIYLDSTPSHISIWNNKIWRAEMAGIRLDGTYGSVWGNEVWDTQQYPSFAGGIYQGCDISNGADADGMRFFGQHHVIQHNNFHGILMGSVTNPNPHTDCYQTWGDPAMAVDDITIAGNICRWPGWLTSSSGGSNHIAMLESRSGPVRTIRFENNILANSYQGILVASGIGTLKVWNNTFDHIQQHAVDFGSTRSMNDEIINNIFFDVGNGVDSYVYLPGGLPKIKTNDCAMRARTAIGTYGSMVPHFSFNPLFVNFGTSTGAGANYHLLPISPIEDLGTTLTAVPVDYDGKRRPPGAGYSIGAFQE